jgi:hypothetical protein
VLTDPRLDLANCTDADGNTVAFVWIEPKAGAAYVGVEHDGWTEIYPVRDDRLPVRVATTEGLDDGDEVLTLTASQYLNDGRNLRKEELEAHVAG